MFRQSVKKKSIFISLCPKDLMNVISFSCLISLARASSRVLNRSGESQHLCPVPDLRAKAFCIKCDTSCNDCVLLEIDFLICSFWEMT